MQLKHHSVSVLQYPNIMLPWEEKANLAYSSRLYSPPIQGRQGRSSRKLPASRSITDSQERTHAHVLNVHSSLHSPWVGGAHSAHLQGGSFHLYKPNSDRPYKKSPGQGAPSTSLRDCFLVILDWVKRTRLTVSHRRKVTKAAWQDTNVWKIQPQAPGNDFLGYSVCFWGLKGP